jgi:translation elongation factor EF-G
MHLQVTAIRQDADTTSGALRYAASMIVADAVQQANAILLEPVMNCEVGVPLSYLGHVLTDLTTHRYASITTIEICIRIQCMCVPLQ